MNPNYPGGDPSYPGNPNNPPSYPQQPGYGQQQPGYPQQPPSYGQQPPTYEPPSYNQAPPPYPQQPYPQQPPAYNQAPPPQYMPQQPPKKSNRGLFIGCGIALVVVLLICGGVGVALYIGAQTAGNALQSKAQQLAATAVATSFCGEMVSQQYSSAYELLSKGEQGRVSQSQFSTRATALDTSDGQLTACEPDPNNPLATISGNTATVRVSAGRGTQASPVNGDIKLVYEDNSWKVDGADSSLKLF